MSNLNCNLKLIKYPHRKENPLTSVNSKAADPERGLNPA